MMEDGKQDFWIIKQKVSGWILVLFNRCSNVFNDFFLIPPQK